MNIDTNTLPELFSRNTLFPMQLHAYGLTNRVKYLRLYWFKDTYNQADILCMMV